MRIDSEKAQSLVEQASSLNAVEYEEALLKCVNGERLTIGECSPIQQEVFLKTATPEAIKSQEGDNLKHDLSARNSWNLRVRDKQERWT